MPASPPNYCPRCGADLVDREIEGRPRRYCPDCDAPVYRNPKPCAGVLVVRGDELLLVRRTRPPSVGTWSIPAGYLERDEPPRRGAVRELREETGVEVDAGAIDLLGTRFVERHDGRYVLVLAYAVDRERTEGEPRPGSDAGDARFWSLSAVDESGVDLEPGYRGLFADAVDRFGNG